MNSNMINKKFGKLTVMAEIYQRGKCKKYLCQCECGNKTTRTKDHLYKSNQCKKCSNDQKRLSFEYVNKYFYDNGCTLLENKYINANTKMRYICKCGKESSIKFASFKNGCRCKECGYKKRNQFGFNNPMWNPDREKILNNAKFRIICKNLVNRSLKNNKQNKTTNTYKLLGYTPEELINHIVSHSSWNNLKHTKWSIDHIFPIKAFLDYGIQDLRIINCLENLQPMSNIDNAVKKDSYSVKEFEQFLKTKGIL
jgi:hypothetical protein